ncbi:tetratricopeptide repeat protein [Phnomibacter ginsenosidimutans]|uniref:Tetratricopeptide repeat protein n=2 Tax=Phnomibacter ginsenosidimutans TaxID=2676868 RepID=A0A6I6G823_9BACT|nr:tetratricopeptide repeat protein [Phnomibacter ginsenosidimutans]
MRYAMTRLLTILLLTISISSCSGQSTDKRQIKKMERYFSEAEFNDNFGKEMVSATSVYDRMVKNGMKDYSLVTFDFIYISNSKERLDSLANFLSNNYGFKTNPVKEKKDYWELTGDATEFPVDEDNLLFWALDLYCKGYEFDCKLDGYGALTDPKNQNFPKLDTALAEHYFDLAMEAYNKRNLGMTIVHLSTVLKLDPKDPNAWYSRAIAKDELHTWKSAQRDYDKAIELAPDFVGALVNRAANRDEAGEYNEALKDYDKAISLDPTNAMAFYNRGNTKHNMGDKQGACTDWKKAKQLGADYAQDRIDKLCK